MSWATIIATATATVGALAGWLLYAWNRGDAKSAQADLKLAKQDADNLRRQLDVAQKQIATAGRERADDARRFERTIKALEEEVNATQALLLQCGESLPANAVADRLRNIDRLLVVGPNEDDTTEGIGPNDPTPVGGLPQSNGASPPPYRPTSGSDDGGK